MFETLPRLPKNAFLRVSADTETGGLPLKLPPAGGAAVCLLPSSLKLRRDRCKHGGYFNK